MLLCCLLVLTVSSIKWADEQDEVDSEMMDANEMLYEEILDELASSDPQPPLFFCRIRCQQCKRACLRLRFGPVLMRRCLNRCNFIRGWEFICFQNSIKKLIDWLLYNCEKMFRGLQLKNEIYNKKVYKI